MININYINKKLVPFIENIVEKSVNKIIYNYVFYIFDKDTLESEYLLDIIELNKNSDGEIVSIDYNFNIAYKYLGNGMNEFYNNLSNMVIDIDYDTNKDGVYFVPVGLIYNNMLLDYLGFKIPCKIIYLSDIDMSFNTKVTDYGMNNLLIELYLVINVKNDLISPGRFYEFGNKYEMNIASKVVMGRIPDYLGSTIEKSSSILSS
jgi:sporulation protein YunB